MKGLKKKFLVGLKIVVISVILAFLDSLLRYLIETTPLLEVTPYSIPFYAENVVKNIIGGWAYLLFFFLWSYILVVVLFHFFKKKLNNPIGYKDIILGPTVCFLFFLTYWGIAENNRMDMLIEGIIIYPVLGIVLGLIHKIFFSAMLDINRSAS